MPRQSIEDLVPPSPVGWPDQPDTSALGWKALETDASCECEDRGRKKTLEAAAANLGVGGKRFRRAARELSSHIGRVLSGRPAPLSSASRLQMREWRIRVVGWLRWLLRDLDDAEWVYFTLVPPSWWVSADELKEVGAKRLMARLRAALQRAGSAEAKGWLYAMIHGGYDGTTDGFPIHVHGIATKGMIKVLRQLRQQPQFRRNPSDIRKYPQITSWKKLQIDRPRGSPMAGISYTSKSIWLQHNTEVIEGMRHRVGRPHRISGKPFIQHLLWLHHQPVRDQVLLVHLSVIKGQLVKRKRRRAALSGGEIPYTNSEARRCSSVASDHRNSISVGGQYVLYGTLTPSTLCYGNLSVSQSVQLCAISFGKNGKNGIYNSE